MAKRGNRRERGISLFVSMILLAAITILTLIAARSTLLELTIAGNEQLRMSAFERAASAIDAMWDQRTSIVDFNSPVGHSNCSDNFQEGVTPDPACADFGINLPDASDSNVWVRRIGGGEGICPPDFVDTSCDYDAVFFEFRSQFDGRNFGNKQQGNVIVTQGVLSLLPSD
ncbi:MAG: PilX N-terminal domain-containing pilus assembly protein [Gammaproteobacteria bacterium]|nr:PilX N-terminal domain-containing pilus assembly protein [Gammaproteobacteria bacterium]